MVAVGGCPGGCTAVVIIPGLAETCLAGSIYCSDDSVTCCDVAGGGGSGDPHMHGANGAKFEFYGAGNGIYNFFSGPEFNINMKLANHGPSKRFMTEIGVTFRDLELTFTTKMPPVDFVENLNKTLSKYGGSASGNRLLHTIELCPGTFIIISNRQMTVDGHTYFFLDINVKVPRCNDLYDGALGETFKCMYEKGHEKFAPSKEEIFRVKTLHTTFGTFSNAGCSKALDNKKQLTGKSSH